MPWLSPGAAAPRSTLVPIALLLAAALAWPSAHAEAPASAAVNLFRLDARARAAAALAAEGQRDDAVVQLDRAGSGPLAALPEGAAVGAHLADLRTAVEAGDAAAATDAVRHIDDAARAELSPTAATDAVRSLIAVLVRDAGTEGREAAGGGGSEPAAYARALAAVALDVARAHRLQATTIGALETLAGSLRAPTDAELIASTADTALSALGAAPAQVDRARAFQAITDDLASAQTRYAAGDAAGAEEALIDAYLEHFEDLEPPLEAVSPALKDRLEHALRDELRSMVRQGATVDAFDRALDTTRADLARAREALK